jgi:hypothetical protein
MRRAGTAMQLHGQRDAKDVPADVKAARERLMTQIQSAAMSMQQSDFEEKLKAVEDTTAVIEKYLKQ